MRVRFLLLSLLFVPTLLRASDGDFDVRPAPAWVERLDVDLTAEAPKSDVRFGVYALLTDHQTKGGVDYYRRVRKVLSASGVQSASDLNLDFDPSFQRLVIHQVELIRNGKHVNNLHPNDIRVMEKNEESSDRIYDGEMSALVIVKDVRPGDVLDYSWSLEGANPILGGKYADEFELSSSVPTLRIRHRLLWPANRVLHYRGAGGTPALQPRITELGAEKEFVWQRTNVAAVDIEDAVPDWYEPWETVQLSDFGSWHEVAQWADALFQLDAKSTAAVKELAAKIRAEHATPRERIVAAIRFVQDDVRYLGIEMGRNSHEPHQPSATLDQRFGDCKDKAFLLSALIRELGGEAYPALVNTKYKHALDDKLPSPFLFDHVIAEVIADGRTYWIDGTIADEGGTLDTIETPNDERALVVRKETAALSRIATIDNGSTVIEQTYTTADYHGPTTLHVRSTYTGRDADGMRSELASLSLHDLAKRRINRYAADQPKIVAVGEPKVRDDRAKDVIVIEERYTIRDLWKNGEWSFYPRLIEDHIRRPETMIRSMPLAVDYPLNITQKCTINLPEHLSVDTGRHVTEGPAFRHEVNVDSNGHVVTIMHSLRSLRDAVRVEDVPDHLTKINEVWDKMGFSLAPTGDETAAMSMASLTPREKWSWGAGGVAVFIGVTCAIAIPAARRRRRRAQFVRARTHGTGETAASAVAVRDIAEIHAHLAQRGCACGAMLHAEGETQRARYDDREMTIVTRHCGTCGREQALYFRESDVASRESAGALA